MSTSGSDGTFVLTTQSDADAELFIIDGDLHLQGAGVGSVTAKLSAGLYKVKANRGGAVRETLVELTRNRKVNLPVNVFPAVAPLAPLLGRGSAKVEALATAAMSRRRNATPGLLILGRRKTSDADGRAPLDGLRFSGWRGKGPAVPFAGDMLVSKEIGGESWAGFWVAAEPGCYVIEIEDSDRLVQQAVLVAPSWQTRIFLRRTPWADSPDALAKDPSLKGRDWIDLSIQMARPDTKVVYGADDESIEVARNALASRRPIFVTSQLIDKLLHGKFYNPIAGLTGLHLFLEAVERKNNPRPNSSASFIEIDAGMHRDKDYIVNEVLKNLRTLLTGGKTRGRLPADLIALYARAGKLRRPIAISKPPMLWASWDVLRRNADRNGMCRVERDLWASIARSTPWGPYLAWAPSTTSVEEYIDKAVPRRVVPTEETYPSLGSDHVGGDDQKAERGARTVVPEQGLDRAELLAVLGIPASVAEGTQ